MRNPFAGVSPLRIPEFAPKAAGSPDRCVPFSETFARIPELRKRYGITRVGDTTYLDRTEIPTFCAVVPKSNDLLSVYNGKGATREASALSAVMEAVERQAGAKAELHLPTVRMRVRDLLEFVDLRAAGIREEALDMTTPCVAATELFGGEVVPMPLAMVQCPWFGEKLFSVTSSNGIASGNNLVEALYHALTEVIERHVWSLFYIRNQLVPQFFLGTDAGDVAHSREIALDECDGRIGEMVERIQGVGLALRLFALEEEPLPLTVFGCVHEIGSDPPMLHNGLGCSLSPVYAVERALTECIQSRVVDIQAAREDILRPDEPEGVFGAYARRQVRLPRKRWSFDLPAPQVKMSNLLDRSSDDLAADVRALLLASRTYGVDRVYAVDLQAHMMSVVRVIVPALERTTIDGSIGLYGRREFNPFFVRTEERLANS